jgi:hypothetical protein
MDPATYGAPNTRGAVLRALEKFDGESDEDFQNLRPLMEGIYGTKLNLGDDFYAKAVRMVGSKGRVFELVELARGSRRTGFKLDRSEKVNGVLHFIQLKAAESGWDRAETEQALRWAETVVELTEDEAHAPKAQVKGDLPLGRDPQVLMAPLHLAAALVVKSGVQDEAAVAKVNKLSSAIVKLWPEGQTLQRLHPLESYARKEQMGYLLCRNKFVTLVSPLLHGLGLALQVVTEPTLATELKSRYETLHAEVDKAMSKAIEEGKFHTGQSVYEMFLKDDQH